MNEQQRHSSKQARSGKRSFTWSVNTADIAFMKFGEAQAAMDGCSSCSDCGCNISKAKTLKAVPARTAAGRR